jgi:hypothetical protein
MKRLGAKRLIALLLGPGVLAIAFDSAIAHFAGKAADNTLQFIPLIYGFVACLGLIAAALPKISRRAFQITMRVFGGTAALVGIAGTIFHLLPIIEDLKDESLTLGSIEGAISLAPPLFAPGAFIGLGGLIWILGSNAVAIRLNLGKVSKKAAAVEQLRLQAVPGAQQSER